MNSCPFCELLGALSPIFEKDMISHATMICQKMSELSYTSGSDKS